MEKRKQASLLNFFTTSAKRPKTYMVKAEVVENMGNHGSLLLDVPSSSSWDNKNNEDSSLHPQNLNIVDDNDIALQNKTPAKSLNYLDLIELTWESFKNYQFPSSTASSEKYARKFQFAWFKKYPWLVYSRVDDAAYCKYCVFFAMHYVGHTSSQPVGYLVQEGFRKWRQALEYFSNHNALEYHKKSLLNYNNLKQIRDDRQKSVDILLDQSKMKEIKENREQLKSIIRAIILCGKQGLALCGHRDRGPIDLDNPPSTNEGNFRAILRFAVQSGDKTLEEHLRTAKKNTLYTSFVIQNGIIETCGFLLQTKIIERVKKYKYSVLIDEKTDVATVEQMSFCLRYFDQEQMKMCEHFLSFVPLTSTTAQSVSQAILKTLKDPGLDIKYLRGQDYDGARVMRGEFNGTQACIAEHQPKAIYVDCMSHCLNLAISDSCQVQDIRNCFGIIEKTYSFLHTATRQEVLSKKIDEFCPESKKTAFKERNCAPQDGWRDMTPY